MPKKLHVSPSQIEHMQCLLTHVEQRRSQPWSEADIQRLLTDMHSADERTRAGAVRQICPCRMPWEVFYRLRSAAKRLQQDPSPIVRAEALHIEEDARKVASMESLRERYQEHQEVEQEKREARHAIRKAGKRRGKR